MPFKLTNAIVIIQSCRQWQRHLLLLFDALIIYNRTWEVHLSQLDEIGGIVAMTGVFHLDLLSPTPRDNYGGDVSRPIIPILRDN
jgi:hypothetical protein